MFKSTIFDHFTPTFSSIVFKRSAANKATDPVQQLFLDMIREYKSKSADGGLVEPNAAIKKEMSSELEKLERLYGGGPGVDMTAFPSIKFDEPKLDPIDEQAAPTKKKKEN